MTITLLFRHHTLGLYLCDVNLKLWKFTKYVEKEGESKSIRLNIAPERSMIIER